MLKDRNEQIQFAVRATDAIICVAAFFAAYGLRISGLFGPTHGLSGIDSLSWMLAASLTLHFLIYPYFRFYESLRLRAIPDLILMVLKAFTAEFFILGSLIFLFQAKDTSRYFFGLYLGINYTLVLAEKVGAKVLLSSIRRRGYNFRQVLIAGTGQNAARVIQSLQKNKHWGYVPCGVLREDGSNPTLREVEGVPVCGTLADLETVVNDKAVDEIYFAFERLDASEITEQVMLCEILGIPIRFSLSLFALPNSKVTFTQLDQLPVVTFYTTLMTPVQAILKRLMDIAIAIVGLAITAVLYPWIAMRIRRESPGPVIFKQVRVGENGRRFKCYKFRTMGLDAEARKKELAAANQMDGPMFKIDRDPRVTEFGAFLRKTSLDELPQFFNILRGDMSVVGTRPPTPDEVSQYKTHFRRRLSIRPGLTGLWQVSGRSQISRFEDVLALDLHYIDHWSIWLDVKIIFRTIWVVLFGRGAY